MLLITPITVRLCKVLDVDPVPVIMSLVIFSNIGGTGPLSVAREIARCWRLRDWATA